VALKPRVVFSPKYTIDIGDHVFPTNKFALTAEALRGAVELVEPALPSKEDLLLAHDEVWIDKVLSGKMSLEDEKLMELPFSPEISLGHRLAVSGTILACRQALETGVGLHAGGGSHHAFADHGEGFCVLNDIACGILKMRMERRISRAAVIDLDVHQGNGTASIFKDDPDVFTFSMHQRDLYPSIKEGSSLDVELKAGTGGKEYLRLLEENIDKIFEIQPELVVYQSGVDCFEHDALGGLKLSVEDLARRDHLVFEACRARTVPAAVVLGGGYGNIKETVSLHASTLRTFAQIS
jgi:acetoin utilization deacetylase AcuC-like enzyme